MKKHLLGLTLWAVYLILFLLMGRVVRQLQDTLNEVKTELHWISQQIQKTEVALEKYEQAHGVAQEDLVTIRQEVESLNSRLLEQDRLVESIGLQLSQ